MDIRQLLGAQLSVKHDRAREASRALRADRLPLEQDTDPAARALSKNYPTSASSSSMHHHPQLVWLGQHVCDGETLEEAVRELWTLVEDSQYAPSLPQLGSSRQLIREIARGYADCSFHDIPRVERLKRVWSRTLKLLEEVACTGKDQSHKIQKCVVNAEWGHFPLLYSCLD